jgi:hypothetical protein
MASLEGLNGLRQESEEFMELYMDDITKSTKEKRDTYFEGRERDKTMESSDTEGRCTKEEMMATNDVLVDVE